MFRNFFRRRRRLQQLLKQAFSKLSAEGFEDGRDYRSIRTEVCCYGGSGIELSGFSSPEVLRKAACCLVDIPACALFYVNSARGDSIYCGPHADDEQAWVAAQARAVEERLNKLENTEGAAWDSSTSTSEPSSEPDLEPNHEPNWAISLETALNELLRREFPNEHFERIVDLDKEGLSIHLYGVPDQETAIALQQAMIREFSELEFFSRFQPEPENWNIIVLDKAPLGH